MHPTNIEAAACFFFVLSCFAQIAMALGFLLRVVDISWFYYVSWFAPAAKVTSAAVFDDVIILRVCAHQHHVSNVL